MTKITPLLVLAFGSSVTLYALSIKKEEPKNASMILTIIGATAGLLSIGSAISIGLSASQALKTGQSLAHTVNSFASLAKVGCPNCKL